MQALLHIIGKQGMCGVAYLFSDLSSIYVTRCKILAIFSCKDIILDELHVYIQVQARDELAMSLQQACEWACDKLTGACDELATSLRQAYKELATSLRRARCEPLLAEINYLICIFGTGKLATSLSQAWTFFCMGYIHWASIYKLIASLEQPSQLKIHLIKINHIWIQIRYSMPYSLNVQEWKSTLLGVILGITSFWSANPCSK